MIAPVIMLMVIVVLNIYDHCDGDDDGVVMLSMMDDDDDVLYCAQCVTDFALGAAASHHAARLL